MTAPPPASGDAASAPPLRARRGRAPPPQPRGRAFWIITVLVVVCGLALALAGTPSRSDHLHHLFHRDKAQVLDDAERAAITALPHGPVLLRMMTTGYLEFPVVEDLHYEYRLFWSQLRVGRDGPLLSRGTLGSVWLAVEERAP